MDYEQDHEIIGLKACRWQMFLLVRRKPLLLSHILRNDTIRDACTYGRWYGNNSRLVFAIYMSMLGGSNEESRLLFGKFLLVIRNECSRSFTCCEDAYS